MSVIDIVLLAVLAVSAVIGLYRGLVREALSLLVWVLAIWAAWHFAPAAAGLFAGIIDDPAFRLWAARLSILIAVLIAGGLATWVIAYLLDSTGLTGTDRLLGGLFGFARGAVLGGLIVIVLQLADFDQAPWWKESKLIPYAAPIAEQLRAIAAQGVEKLDEAVASD